VYRSRPLDEQKTHPAGIEKRDFPVRLRMKELAANHLSVEFGALFWVADGNTEMRDAFDGRHYFSPQDSATLGNIPVTLRNIMISRMSILCDVMVQTRAVRRRRPPNRRTPS
jgi:hypothetical protein